MSPIQPTKSKSLLELPNLIQIKESVVVTLPFFSVVFIHFQLRFSVLKQRKQGYYEFDVRFHTRVGESN